MTIPEYIVSKLTELSIEAVAQKLGIDVKNHKAICFMHNDHSPSIKFSVRKNIYYCFVCGKGGGPIQLAMEYERWTFQEACVWLGKEFNIWWPQEKDYKKPYKKLRPKVSLNNIVEPETIYDKEACLWLIESAKLSETAKRFLFNQRHYKENVVQRLRIKSVTYPKQAVAQLIARFGEERSLNSGLVRKGKCGLYFYFFTPCLLFPYYEQDGTLAGVQSRFLGDKKDAPRFQFMSSQKTRLFNLPLLNDLKRGDRLYISEGLTDCLALLSDGKNAVAIPSATIMPFEDLMVLKKFDLHMYPDQDIAGRKAFVELRRFFVNHYATLTAEKLPDGVKDYSEYYIQKKESDGEE